MPHIEQMMLMFRDTPFKHRHETDDDFNLVETLTLVVPPSKDQDAARIIGHTGMTTQFEFVNGQFNRIWVVG